MLNNITDKLFRVRVPLVATYSFEELEVFGLPVDVIEGETVNESCFKETVNVHVRLDKLVEYHSMGYPIYITNRDELVDLYKIMENYLITSGRAGGSLNNQTVEDTEYMSKIDLFCEEILGLNKATIVNKTINLNDTFNLGLSTMSVGRPQAESIDVGSKYGSVMSGYDTPSYETGNSYVNNNNVSVDINKVTRRRYESYDV